MGNVLEPTVWIMIAVFFSTTAPLTEELWFVRSIFAIAVILVAPFEHERVIALNISATKPVVASANCSIALYDIVFC